jgi:hypothetical protein
MRKLPLTAAEDLLEILMWRYERTSTLITSKWPVDDKQNAENPPDADAFVFSDEPQGCRGHRSVGRVALLTDVASERTRAPDVLIPAAPPDSGCGRGCRSPRRTRTSTRRGRCSVPRLPEQRDGLRKLIGDTAAVSAMLDRVLNTRTSSRVTHAAGGPACGATGTRPERHRRLLDQDRTR